MASSIGDCEEDVICSQMVLCEGADSDTVS